MRQRLVLTLAMLGAISVAITPAIDRAAADPPCSAVPPSSGTGICASIGTPCENSVAGWFVLPYGGCFMCVPPCDYKINETDSIETCEQFFAVVVPANIPGYLNPDCWEGKEDCFPAGLCCAWRRACVLQSVDCSELETMTTPAERCGFMVEKVELMLEGEECCPADFDSKFAAVCEFLKKCGATWKATACPSGPCTFCEEVTKCIHQILGCVPQSVLDEMAMCVGADLLTDCDCCKTPEGSSARWQCGEELECDQDCDEEEGTCDDLRKLLSDSQVCYDPAQMTRADAIAITKDFLAQCASGNAAKCAALVDCLQEYLFETFGDQGDGHGLTDEELADLQGTSGCSINMEPPIPPVPPEDEDLDKDGDDDDCEGAGGEYDPIPGGRHPIDLAFGHKNGSATDLSVSAAGGGFRLARKYRSEDVWTAARVSGSKWALSTAEYMSVSTQDGHLLLRIRRGTARPEVPIVDENDLLATIGGALPLPGPSHRVIKRTQACVDGVVYPVWRIEEPGRTSIDYFRAKASGETIMGGLSCGSASSVTAPDAALLGLRLRTFDIYGNGTIYKYLLIATGTGNVARLERVYVDGYPGSAQEPAAQVTFTWNFNSTSPNFGRLRRAEVVRDVGTTTPVLVPVERVEYTYMGDDSSFSADLGTNGDLVQVIKSERIDPAPGSLGTDPVWRQTIAQYRYHRTSCSTCGVDEGDRSFSWLGRDGQLKMEIHPQQVEFVAALSAAEPLSTRVATTAAHLLTLADGAEAASGILVVDLAAKIIEQYESSSPYRVLTQYLISDCGCSGGAGSPQGRKFTYEYYSFPSHATLQWSTHEIEHIATGNPSDPWDRYRATYYDLGRRGPTVPGMAARPPFMINKAIANADDSLIWATHHEYNGDGLVTKVFTPSSCQSYDPDPASDHSLPGAFVAKTTVGLVHSFEYDSSKRRTEEWVERGSTPVERAIVTRTTWGAGTGSTRTWLPATIERFRVATDTPGSLGGDDIETTEFAYQFSAGDKISATQTKTEWDGRAFNGPDDGGSPPLSLFVYAHEFFDSQGRNYWSRAADGALTRREFDPRSGRVTLVEQNADDGSSFPSTTGLTGTFTGLNGSGGSLVSATTYDLLGRVQRQTSPAGVNTYTRRELRECADHPGLEYLAIVTLPHELGSSDHAGPASIRWVNASGAEIAAWDCPITGTYDISSGGEPWPQVITDYAISTSTSSLLARASTERNVAGQAISRTAWHDPSGAGPDAGKVITKFFHDPVGRLDYTINAVGTVTQQLYDVLDRVVETKVGIADADEPDQMSTVAKSVFDGSGDTPGSGNGNLTRQRVLAESSNTFDRITNNSFDWRDRLVMVESPLAPHAAQLYDNLGRVTERAMFDTLPGSVPTGFSSADSTRVALEKSTYTQRGLVAWTELATNPGAASGSRVNLTSANWFDEVGRTVGTWAPSSPAMKATFDGLGRAIATYLTDRGGDAIPGAGSHIDVWSPSTRAAVPTGDRVIEVTEQTFVAGTESSLGGMPFIATRLQRIHSPATDTGVPASADFIATFQTSHYDAAARQIAIAEWGTNQSTFAPSGSAPTSSDAVPNAVPTTGGALVTQFLYDPRGLANTRINPGPGVGSGSRVDRTLVDALGRTIATIENDDDSSVTVAWNTGGTALELSGIDAGNDIDRTTTFVRNGIGQVTKLTAHANGDTGDGNDQVTQYVYGVTTSAVGPSGGPTIASSMVSNDLLLKTIFPLGQDSTSEASRTVWHSWNRIGERTGIIDQNKTKHAYGLDKLGRVTSDAVTASATHIDTTINNVTFSFDNAGRLGRVVGLNSTTIKNEVEFTYTGLGQIAKVYQHQKGAVSYDGSGIPTGDTRLVSYAYSDAAVASGSAGSNYSRLTGLSYPRRANSSGVSPETIDTVYGSSTSLADRISRVTQNKFNLTSSSNIAMANFEYVGMATPALMDLEQADVQLDFTLSLDGKRWAVGYTTQSPRGFYPGYDRFGRLALQTWADGSLTTQLVSGNRVPTRPQIVALQYGYDDELNRTSVYDRRHTNQWPMSHAFTYDGMNRVASAMRNTYGNLSGGSPSNAQGSQEWSLDLLGNWIEVSTWDATPAQQTESRDHDNVNQLNARDFPGATPDETLEYDDAGNLLTRTANSVTTSYRYDPWNRLAQVKVSSRVQLEQAFNGLGWRTLKREDTDQSGGLDEERALTYSAGWQLLEERVDDNYVSSPGLNKRVQYVWGQRYIDECLMHRADVNNDGDYVDSGEGTYYHCLDGMFSTVAVLNRSGGLVERVTYDSYGVARHHRPGDVDGNGSSGSTDKAIVDAIIAAGSSSIGQANYRAEADLDRNGVINSTDGTFANVNASALAAGLISVDTVADNSIGWDGYAFNPAVANYLARNRTYEPPLGRWSSRDPAGYVDSLSLYQFVGGRPIIGLDPLGLNEYSDALSSLQGLSKKWNGQGWDLAAEILDYFLVPGRGPGSSLTIFGYGEKYKADYPFMWKLWNYFRGSMCEHVLDDGCNTSRRLRDKLAILGKDIAFYHRFESGELFYAHAGASIGHKDIILTLGQSTTHPRDRSACCCELRVEGTIIVADYYNFFSSSFRELFADYKSAVILQQSGLHPPFWVYVKWPITMTGTVCCGEDEFVYPSGPFNVQ